VSDTICRHDSALILDALNLTRGMSDELLCVMVAGARAKGNGGPKTAAAETLLDPAKLTELMMMALRARGFDAACDWSDRHDFYVAWWPNDPQYVDGTQWIHVRAGSFGRFKGLSTNELDMPATRAKLLRIMRTPADETSRDECERIVRGDNGAPFAVDAWPNPDEVA